jgi:hypothetical protein
MKTLLCFFVTLGLAQMASAQAPNVAQTETDKPGAAQAAKTPPAMPPVHEAPSTGDTTTTLTNQKNDQMKPATEEALKPLEKDANAKKKRKKK